MPISLTPTALVPTHVDTGILGKVLRTSTAVGSPVPAAEVAAVAVSTVTVAAVAVAGAAARD